MASIAESLSYIKAEGKACPCDDVVAVIQLTETLEREKLPSLMAQKNEKSKIPEEKPEVVEGMQRLSLSDAGDNVHTKSRQKRDRLQSSKLEAEQQQRKNKELKVTRKDEDQESNSGTLPADLSRSVLPVTECSKIKEHLIFLTDELVPGHFIPFLFSNKVINDEQREDLVVVFDNQGGRKCTETLLYILLHVCSETIAYGLFCQCLLEEKYYKALQKLEPKRTDITDEQLKTSRGKLPEKEYSLIQDHMDQLIRDIMPIGYIRRLFTTKVFTEEEKERLYAIENRKGRAACVDAMLCVLLRCGEFGFQKFLEYLNKENPSNFNILFPGNRKGVLAVKYSDEKHEYVSNPEEYTDRVSSNVNELLPGRMATVLDVRKGCVQVIFEINSLDKTDKDQLEAVLQTALKSGYIGPDAISNLEFKPIDDDGLTDEEVEKEIQMFEEENARLRQEHQRLLALPEKIPTGHRIPDKETDPSEYQLLERSKMPHKTKGKMLEKDYERMRRNYMYLLHKITDTHMLITNLFRKGVIDENDVSMINYAKERGRGLERDQVHILLDTLMCTGAGSFQMFLQSLRETGHSDIAFQLERDELTDDKVGKEIQMFEEEKITALLEKIPTPLMYTGHRIPDKKTDELPDEEVEKEIQMFEEENVRLRQEHLLLALPEKIPTEHRIPDKKTGMEKIYGRRRKKRGPMKDDDVSVIVKNYVCLVETIDVQYVQPFLILEFILDRQDIDRLTKASTVSRRGATRELLHIVMYESGSDVFPIFVKCLYDAGYDGIASKLQTASGYIGHDAISNLEFKPIDDDKLTDFKVGKEIPMFEERKVTALPEKIPTPLTYKGFRIPDKKTDRQRKERNPMEKDDKLVILENYVCLKETIDVQYLQLFLILEFILDRQDINRVRKASKVNKNKAKEELLNIVTYESGSDIFPKFVKCLYDAGYENIAIELLPSLYF